MGKQKPEAISTYKWALLARLVNFLTSLAIAREQRKLLMKSFMESQFGYFPLKWMFWGRKTNARINHVHERGLIRVVYKINRLWYF